LPGWRNLPAGRQVGRHKIMYYVYAIKSQEKNYIYVGLTNNLDRRFSEHNNGKNKTTKPYKPFKIIYTEKFETRIEARVKEKYLKSGIGKEFLKML
jgi:putative endonuclease